MTERFTLAGDAALRILPNAAPFKLVVQKDDGTLLADVAVLGDGMLGLMALPEGGTYRLLIEAHAEWGVSIVYRDASGNPPANPLPAARLFPGSPPPPDVFQPHMPSVYLFADMDAFFAKVWADLAASIPEAASQRGVAVITPTRGVLVQTVPPPEGMPPDVIESVKQLLSPCSPAMVSVISHTAQCQTIEDLSKCIPFFGYLLALASIGHRVLVFEGHPSAFESGVRHADVLFMDSGMLPFIQRDWQEIARKSMRPQAKIFVHDRDTYRLLTL